MGLTLGLTLGVIAFVRAALTYRACSATPTAGCCLRDR